MCSSASRSYRSRCGAPILYGCAACKLTNRVGGLDDVGAFIRNSLHVLLAEAMPHELPSPLLRCQRDRLIRAYRGAVDGQYGTNSDPVQDLQHSPEAHTITIF